MMKKTLTITVTFVIMTFGMLNAQDQSAMTIKNNMNDAYYKSRKVDAEFNLVINRVKEALQEEGFGVVSEIDMQAKLKKGTGNDILPYTILGACNPAGAYRALQIEEHIGVMLPCNMIVRELENGGVEVAAINPEKTMQSIGNPDMKPLAAEISEKLGKVLENF